MFRFRSHIIFLLALIAITAQAQIKHPAYDLMLDAATRVRAAQKALYERQAELGLFDKELDHLHTGVIGIEYSSITTTIGYIKAKRSAANPDFAAHIVRELVDHGIDSEDSVLVTMTGSFPGMNLSVLTALDVLEIPALIICSVGASSYGANQIKWTWLDMEDYLYRHDLLHRRSDFVTLGGTGDVGGGLQPEARKILRQRAFELNYPVIKANSFTKQTNLRRERVGDPGQYDLLVNVGGNHAMLGNGPWGRLLPGGWNEPSVLDAAGDSLQDATGIIFDFLKAGIPVMNLLHIESVAGEAGLPFDPDHFAPPGKADVYYLLPRNNK